MFNLDPGKLIVIGVVAIILLGPDKLPQFARQVGGAWRTFNEFRHRMESEVRSSMPDLPPTSEIARLARSPSALLNHLSSMAPEEETEGTGDAEGTEGSDATHVSEGSEKQVPDGSFQPPGTNGTGETPTGVAAENGAGAEPAGAAPSDRAGAGETATPGSGSGSASVDAHPGAEEPAAPATNGRSAVAPQPAEVAIPADPTLN